MAAATLDTDHPGLRVLAEVASILSVDLASPAALAEVVAALRRGLSLQRCRLWVRNDAGTAFAVVCSPGDEAELPGYHAPVGECSWAERLESSIGRA